MCVGFWIVAAGCNVVRLLEIFTEYKLHIYMSVINASSSSLCEARSVCSEITFSIVWCSCEALRCRLY